MDQYPYTAASTSIQGGLLESWAQDGGRDALLARLRDETSRRRILLEVARAIETRQGDGDPSSVVIASCPFDPALAGKSLAQNCGSAVVRLRSTRRQTSWSNSSRREPAPRFITR